MQKEIFFHAVRLVLNTASNSDEYPDFADPREAMALLAEAKKQLQESFVGLHTKLQENEIAGHMQVFLSNLGVLFQLCTPQRQCTSEEQVEALNCLMRMSLSSAHILARRRSAMDRLEKTRELLSKRQKGRDEGPQAKRKQLIVRLYAQRRLEWENANQAANALLSEAISIARGVGYPLAEDRAKKTIHEWFLEYDKAEPRNQ